MRERQLRLVSGLVLALFIIGHLLSHALGLISIQWMEKGREIQAVLWQNPLGTLLLYAAFAIHFFLGVRALYRRRTLNMPIWEAAQLTLGLAMPLLLAGHVMGTRVGQMITGVTADYPRVMALLWTNNWFPVKQSLAVLIVWGHVCIGLHFWLRLYRWYPRARPALYAFAIAIPLLSLLGFARAGFEHRELSANPVYLEEIAAKRANVPAHQSALVKTLVENAPTTILVLYVLTLLARQARVMLGRRRGVFVLRHANGRNIHGQIGQSVLETLRMARVPHASVCGGRARCTTCRVRIGQGMSSLPPPSKGEAAALERIGAPGNVRLACQLRPSADVDVTPVLSPDVGALQPGGVQGREQEIAAMFVDLRGSTAMGERKLPYDVVFVLNRFFEEMSAALADTNGHYAQFAGDGLMALYGLSGGIGRACRDSLRGALEMHRRLQRLNERLSAELNEPLRMGIGIHTGEAIVGTMGPPSSPNLSAVGDNINIAARLEQQTKLLDCSLVISAAIAERAGIDLSQFPRHVVPVRGRDAPIEVYAVNDPAQLEALLASAASAP
ncbi:MAG: adenylate cyclase [Gammaproteobacteria bacterium]|jgi:adenylate cyclase